MRDIPTHLRVFSIKMVAAILPDDRLRQAAPAVFYGDEAGVTGGEDPFNRVTYPWSDLAGIPDPAMLADYKRLIRLRNTHTILRRGSIDAPAYIDAHVIVLIRRAGRHLAITATNNDAAPHTISIMLPTGGAEPVSFTEALTGARIDRAGRSVTFTVPALFGTMFEDSLK